MPFLCAEKKQIKIWLLLLSLRTVTGGYSHDLGLQFRSPTVNLWFKPEDFLKLLQAPTKYIGKQPIEVLCDSVNYPVGKIDDITIFFQHYKNFDEAKQKWLQRSERVDYNNLFIIMTDRDGCTEEMIKEFDELPYKNKVIFTHKPYPKYKSAFYIPGFEDAGEVGILTEFKPGLLKRKYIDSFDIVRFLNSKA